ncbi:MAG: carboxypeptidase regulatory-like domain-containing protein [Acidobacteriia bacterium]|nr:carboxypeptidase regulatory-like domain-containing protein [Terriglobia bacterium]
MKKKLYSLAVGVFACLLLQIPAISQSSASLTGIVSSDAEGPMEGVLVKAKQATGNITITVVSDAQGRYAFPADKIKPGEYTVSVRATGYEVPNRSMPVTVGAETTKADIKLRKVSTFVLVDQLTPAEIVNSLPGTPAQAKSVTECGVCHSMSRILKSTHDPEEWKATILRMRNHTPSANDTHPESLPFHVPLQASDEALANYLATINLSTKSEWDYQFKPYARPKGESTKVVITEYDLPRRDGEPHDAVMDSEGMIWYADFVAPIIGRLNPRTGEFKEWPLPEIKPGFPTGSLGVALDPKGNPWIGRAFQGGVATMDKKTEKITSYRIPKDFDNEFVRNTFIAVGKDGTVCFDDPFNRNIFILDPETGKVNGYPAYPGWKFDLGTRNGTGPNGEKDTHFMYGVAMDSKGTCYWGDTGNRYIGTIDSKTGKTELYPTPTPMSFPHRIEMAADDQLWFAEINAKKIGHFDTKTKKFQEWAALGDDDPYGVALDAAGFAWTGGTPTDYVTRLNPKTGQMIQYLLPNSNINIRRVRTYDMTNPPSMLIGENHQAKIALIQSLN